MTAEGFRDMALCKPRSAISILLVSHLLNNNMFTFSLPIDYSYLLGFSFRPRTSSLSDTPLTWNTCHLTPGMSPMAPPIEPPIPSNMTSSCSSTKFNAPSRGRKAVIDLPFFINCTLTHFLTAELGCLDSIPTFSKTIPLACGDPSRGFAFLSSINILLLKYLLAHLAFFLFELKTRPANRPNGDLAIYIFPPDHYA